MNITCAKRYLNIPVRVGAPKRAMTLSIDGRVMRRFEVELAETEPSFWTYLDLMPFAGREILVDIDPPLARADLLQQSDSPIDSDDVYDERSTVRGARRMRPAFHFTSKRGWLNDPNGLVYYDGEYHLFYQHNPFGTEWGNMHWGHAVSPDLLHWEELGDALHMAEHSRGMCFLGCAIVDEHNLGGFQTGPHKTLLAYFTDTGLGECLTYSTDRGRTWRLYDGNPVVKHTGRDPKVFWYAEPGSNDGHWVMVLYDEDESGQDCIMLVSDDLKAWRTTSRRKGYYECPDLIQLPMDGDAARAKWVLYAADGRYEIGSFDGRVFTPETDRLQLWRGAFYAAQTYSGVTDGRCIQIGWARGVTFHPLPFNQQMAVPVELTLRTTANGLRLCAQPVRELEALRLGQFNWSEMALPDSAPQDMTVASAGTAAWGDAPGYDLQLDVDVGAARRIVLSVFGAVVEFEAVGQTLRCGAVSAPHAPDGAHLRLRVLKDHGSLEVFAGADAALALSVADRPAQIDQSIWLCADGGAARLCTGVLYGLRSVWRPAPLAA